MNLSAYDIIKPMNYAKTWINLVRKRLYSGDIPYRKYYAIANRYNVETKDYNYYIILTDIALDDPKTKSVIEYKKGFIRLDLREYWSRIKKSVYDTEDVQVKVSVEEEQDDCIIYRLELP